MSEIRETKLPGVGLRYEFTTQEGKQVSVISHYSGRREICLADPDDPDAFRTVLGLSERDTRTLTEVLGGSRVAEELAELQQRIEGLAIDWLPIREDSPYAGHTIGEAAVRSRTGVSIVAVLRGDQAIPAPGAEQVLEAGDYIVVVGTARGIESLVERLRTH